MPTDRSQKKSHSVTGRQKRLTIGVLASDLDSNYVISVWSGIVDKVEQYDANLICFEGGVLHVAPETGAIIRSPANTVYDLATSQTLDGLLILNTMVAELDTEQLHAVCRSYHPLPIVLTGLSVPGIPRVVVDNTTGIKKVIQHFVEVHGYRRIAFICGIERSNEAQLRYHTYCDTLQHYGIPVDASLVFPGNFTFVAGKEAAARMIADGKTDIDAIIGANDETALGAMEVLQQHGIRVPQDIALAGFDDIEETATVTPAMTTVRQPMHTLGCRAVEMLFHRMNNEPTAEEIVLPTDLVVRESCGCENPLIGHAAVEISGDTAPSLDDLVRDQGHTIRIRLRQSVGMTGEAEPGGWEERLLQAFLDDVRGQAAGAFLSTFEECAVQFMPTSPNLNAWHDAISIVREFGLKGTRNEALCARIEVITGQARILLGDLVQSVQGRHLDPQRFQQFQYFWRALSTHIELDQILDVLTQELPRLDIPACYLALYESSDNPLAAARLILASDETGRQTIPAERFVSTRLLPEGVLSQEAPVVLLLEPLVFRTQQIGFALFGIKSREGRMYRFLGMLLSNALNAAQLFQQERRAQALFTVQPIIRHMQEVSALLEKASERLTGISTNMAASVDQTSQQVGAMSAHNQQINHIIQQVSTAAQEGSSGIDTISQTVTDVDERVKRAVETAQTAKMAVQSLDVNARQIGSVLEVVNGVAKQTKFLALYAAIVAAQSGTFSAGFSVVAKEVKTLAQETASSVKHIAQNMKAIQTNTHKAGQAIVEVVRIIDRVAELSAMIQRAMAEQTDVARHISETIHEAAHDSAEITQAVADVAATAQESSVQAAQVQIAAQELFALANQLGHLAQEIQTS